MLGNSEDLTLTVRVGLRAELGLGLHWNQEQELGSVNLDLVICPWFREAKISSKDSWGRALTQDTFPSRKQQPPPSCLPAAGVLWLKTRLWSPPGRQ